MNLANKFSTAFSLIAMANSFYIVHLLLKPHTKSLSYMTVTKQNGTYDTYCDPHLVALLREVRTNDDLYPIALNDYNEKFTEPGSVSEMFLFDRKNKYVDVSIFWMEFELFEIRYYSLFEVTELFIVFENKIDHFGLYKGCLLSKSKLFHHIQNKLYYWCDTFESGEKGLNHEFKFSKFVWGKTLDIIDDKAIRNSYVGFSHVDEIPNEYSIFKLLTSNQRSGVMYQDGTFFYGNIKLLYKNIYMEDSMRNNSFPYPVIWPQELMKEPPKDFKYRECYKDCNKMEFGVHLSPWPNPITEAIKYLMCSECEGRSINKVIEHCQIKGRYKTLMPGGIYYKLTPKPSILPRYLSSHASLYSNFYMDYLDV